MQNKVTIEINGQTFEIDIAKMAEVIENIGWGAKSSAERNFKKGKYVNVIDRIIIDRIDMDINDITNEQRINIAKELI